MVQTCQTKSLCKLGKWNQHRHHILWCNNKWEVEESHEGINGSHFQESYMDVGEIAPIPQTNFSWMDFQDQGRST